MLIIHLLSGVNLPQGFDTPRIVPVSAIGAVLSLALAGITAGLYPGPQGRHARTGRGPAAGVDSKE